MILAKKWLMVILLAVLILPVTFAIKTLQAQETNFLQLKPQSSDPDNDKVTYTYSPPFNDQGEWQTGYNDAGEYNVEIIASDGMNETKEKVKVIVENKNQPPRLTEKKLSVKEMQIVDLKKVIEDPDGDDLEFQFFPPFNPVGQWKTGYNDEGEYNTTFTVFDGEFTEHFTLPVEVLHTNQPPSILNSFSEEKFFSLSEDDTLDFFVDAQDNDGDSVFYQWTLDGASLSEEKKGEKHFSFDEAGKHVLEVTVNDGQKNTSQSWSFEVKNVNRQPHLTLLPMAVYEGETVALELPEKDEDGDTLSYSFGKPLTPSGVWKTGYDDAGVYNLTVTAFDGELEGKATFALTVKDVDRAPELDFPRKVLAREGELFVWKLEAYDPDGDKLHFRFEGLPDGFVFDAENSTLHWQPGYDFIHRSGSFFSKLLNRLRLERYFLKKKEMPLTIVACGKELCSTSTVTLHVENVNRAPLFDAVSPLQVAATELAQVNVTATDPDGDMVHYYFTKPFDKSGTWKTTPLDVGAHTIYVTASDGKQETTIPLLVTVMKKNRLPVLELSQEKVVVHELQEFTLRISASDMDNDPLSLQLENPPKGASFKEGIFVWNPDVTTVQNITQKTFWLRFTASDGEANVTAPVQVTVKNTNQPPEIIDYLPVQEKEAVVGEPILFHIAAKDIDGDELRYRWEFGFAEKSVSGTDTIERTFTSSGLKKVKVIVSDGHIEAKKEFSIWVKAPEAQAIALTKPSQPPASQPPFTVGVYSVRQK